MIGPYRPSQSVLEPAPCRLDTLHKEVPALRVWKETVMRHPTSSGSFLELDLPTEFFRLADGPLDRGGPIADVEHGRTHILLF